MKSEAEFEITHEGVLHLGEFDIPCYVLKNGERVLSTTGMQRALGVIGNEPHQRSSGRLDEILSSKAVKPYIARAKASSKYAPIQCLKGKQKISAYRATALPEICDIMLQVRDHAIMSGVELGSRQQAVIIQSDLIIRALAKVGIIALVDEVTGYEKIKEKDALQIFLQKFLDEEKGKWVSTFEPAFFEAIFKMKGWTWKQASTKKPQVVGHYINNYVYSRLAPQVLAELRKVNPKNENGVRKGKHTQWINPEFGHPKLKEHINVLTMFAKAAGYNWNSWHRMVERALPKYNQDGSMTLELPFNDEE
jgi:hypothetical protein